MASKARKIWVWSLLLSTLLAVACTILVFRLIPSGWTVSPDFDGEDARFEISGVACDGNRCLAVNDEEEWAQTFTIQRRRIVPGQRVRLLPQGSGEIDAEAAAFGGGYFYVTGSHGLSRKKAERRDSQFFVFRWKPGSEEIDRSDRLRDIILNAASIAPFVEQKLDENGANIEGMAAAGDRLFFGFRGPSVEGNAFILELSADALFGGASVPAITHEVPLGERIGIRDMARFGDGFLLLTGPVNTDPKMASIVLWKPGDTPETLAILRPVPGGKPEALLVLENPRRVLVFYDSLRNGAPRDVALTP